MVDIKGSYPVIYGGGGRSKPHCKEYRDFAQDWGLQKTVYEMADSDITKIAEIYQIHLNDFLMYLTYSIKKAEVDDIEDAFQEGLRKAKRGR